MPTMQGTVKWVGSKTIRNSQLWSFSLNESQDFFRTGFDQPSIARGDAIMFDYEVNQYGNQVKAKAIRVIDAPKAVAQTGAGAGRPDVGKDQYWKNKEDKDVIKDAAIQFLSCTNTAVSVLKLALDAGVLNLGSGTKTSKLDALLAQVYLVRDELYTQAEEARSRAKAGGSVVESVPSEDTELDGYLGHEPGMDA